jgi:hypothetical protein
MEIVMRSILEMDTVQIEVTNVCKLSCSNCTRFCPQIKKPYFMELNQFKQAIDSMIGYPNMIGFQGGEPLLHPQFEKLCEYASMRFPKQQLGLWTTLPVGYEHYREIICNTFHHIFVNDHTRDDIYHHAGLVAIEEVIKDKHHMWHLINRCWAQESWSASINPRGAWFCEIAAALSLLFEEDKGWPVTRGWWHRIPKDFTSQMEMFCPRCGMAAPIHRRISTEGIDDISPNNLRRLKNKIKNPKRFKVHDLQVSHDPPEPLAAYKDFDYRNKIANRYNMFLLINEQNFWTPYLRKNSKFSESKPMIEICKEIINE